MIAKLVTHMSRTPNQGGNGLRGRDQQQGDLRDTRGGTFDVRAVSEDALPEGLKRERKGPLGPKERASGPEPLSTSETGKR